MAVVIACVLLYSLAELAPRGVNTAAYSHQSRDLLLPKPAVSVFYPHLLVEDCGTTVTSLDRRQLLLDENIDARIGLLPDWEPRPNRSPYFMFNIHTLRFLACHILFGARGQSDRLSDAQTAILNWATDNDEADSAGKWAWSEHATAWRAVVISYLWHVSKATKRAEESEVRQRIQDLAQRHADLLLREDVYKRHHNHGLNNSLGLLALGVAFSELAGSRDWIVVALNRAEQQIRDNVSSDGIHLEQSGFYHVYTLRSFWEIERVASLIGSPMSASYLSRTDRMMGAAASMISAAGTISDMQYSDPELRIFEQLLPTLDSDSQSVSTAGLDRLRVKKRGGGDGRLDVYPHGGYSFFDAPPDSDQVRVVFHTRVLDAPHFQEDAMGITASLHGKPLILMPSNMLVSNMEDKWRNHFLTAPAHNTVAIAGLHQEPPGHRRKGPLANFFASTKVNRLADRVGLRELLVSASRRLNLDHLPLVERAAAAGGRIVSVGASGTLHYVTAEHETYANVIHRRTVARVDQDLVLVRDLLSSDSHQEYTQTFHFPNDVSLSTYGERGAVTRDNALLAQFIQLNRETTHETCLGRVTQGDKCGWSVRAGNFIRPTPTLRYHADGGTAEFLWIIYTGSGTLDASIVDTKEDQLQVSVRTEAASDKSILTLRLFEDGSVELQQSESAPETVSRLKIAGRKVDG